MSAGVSFFDAYSVAEKRKEIDAMQINGKNAKGSVKEAEFKTWLSAQPWTDAQKKVIQEEYGEWRTSGEIDTENYDLLAGLPGWNNEDANAVYRTLGALTPEGDAEDVSDWQKRSAIAGMSLSEEKKYDALRVIDKSSDGAISKLDSAESAGISAKDCVIIWKDLAQAKGHDLDGNGETDTNSLKNARAEMIRGYTHLTERQKNAIWRWYYKTGKEDGWKYRYKEGKG